MLNQQRHQQCVVLRIFYLAQILQHPHPARWQVRQRIVLKFTTGTRNHIKVTDIIVGHRRKICERTHSGRTVTMREAHVREKMCQ